MKLSIKFYLLCVLHVLFIAFNVMINVEVIPDPGPFIVYIAERKKQGENVH